MRGHKKVSTPVSRMWLEIFTSPFCKVLIGDILTQSSRDSLKNIYIYWKSRGRRVGVCQAQNVRTHAAPSKPVTVWAWSCFQASAAATFACITYDIRASENDEAPNTPAAAPEWHAKINEGKGQRDPPFAKMRVETRDESERQKKVEGRDEKRRRRLMCKSSADVFPAEMQVNTPDSYLEYYSNKCQQDPLTCYKWVFLFCEPSMFLSAVLKWDASIWDVFKFRSSEEDCMEMNMEPATYI